MNITVQEIDKLLITPNKPIRRASDYDLILIKNELISLLTTNADNEEQRHIRQLINELHLLKITVDVDNEEQVVYAYGPPARFNRKLTLTESGWIAITK